ncbi:hypothetical protein FQA39_LY14090 [Lamprigera yunnana]|nr:hypothetical protein FQA39_LY14090 [Lamprigera yunnana]
MALCRKVSFLVFTLIIVYAAIKMNNIFETPPVPNFEQEYWGPGAPSKDDASIRPFKINVPEQVLTVLKSKLNQPISLTPPLEGIQQQYGMNTNLLKKIVEFWKTKYNWREREQYLNKYQQFQTRIQGLNIHFLHVKPTQSKGKKVLPLLLLHGWPGSIREFYEIIPLLTTPQNDQDFVFEVIAPSLPGYGFSEGSSKPGLGSAQIAHIFKVLMQRLNFDKYYVQGGDWGAFIGSFMSAFYPNHILGFHSNMCGSQMPLSTIKLLLGSLYPPLVVDEKHQDKMYPLGKIFSKLLLESGYMHLQATKPDTIGVALGDSPIGLAAYILEKFTSWTNPKWQNTEDGGLELKYTYTNLLDNIMIYWVTGSITTSMRLYSESFINNKYQQIPIMVPTACARFPYELLYQSDSIIKDTYKSIVQITDMPTGGHFAAFEEPKLLANDIWSGIQKMRKMHHKDIPSS